MLSALSKVGVVEDAPFTDAINPLLSEWENPIAQMLTGL
jgi:hypothetical protein